MTYTYEDLYCADLGFAELLPESEYPRVFPSPKEMTGKLQYKQPSRNEWDCIDVTVLGGSNVSGCFIPRLAFTVDPKRKWNSQEIKILEREIAVKEADRKMKQEITNKEKEKYNILRDLNDITSLSFNPLAALKYNLGIYTFDE